MRIAWTTWSRLSDELAERLDEAPRAVAIPPVQVGDFLELLPALSWNQEELGAGSGSDVMSPQSFSNWVGNLIPVSDRMNALCRQILAIVA